MPNGKKTSNVRIMKVARAGLRAAPANRKATTFTTPEERAQGAFYAKYGLTKMIRDAKAKGVPMGLGYGKPAYEMKAAA